MYNLCPYHYLRKFLITKIGHLAIYGHKVSHVSEMSFSFISNLKNITYETYLKQPKSMLEWTLIEKLARNPKFLNAFDRTLSHPLIQEFLTSIQ